ncbi:MULTISPECIES: HAMP domain-containing sensor histidine kinase [Peptostreptococcales]|uniref:HAMP domain-containing sensor histidine kinase n=1 Tax=Peptostreptococcales TaxID=3082720 RepID=UPI000E4A7F9B|nr:MULTISPECIES: HAMP domain-containing sensor histidine kinase [Peptostreptococcaceae]MEE0248204.1 ATP-binding protein [Peptacetobacter hiranonis]RHQ99858.1 sensor histidine kinase [Peptoclostridium sp. AF21-18]
MDPINIELIVTLISVVIAIVSARYAINVRKYLREIIDVSKRVSNNEHHARMDLGGNGELGEFAKNYNEMIKSLYNTFDELEYKNLQLRSILKSISNGILAIDIEGNILLINDEAKKMINCPKEVMVEGRNISFAIRNDLILKQIMMFMGSKVNEKTIINMEDGRFLRIKLDPVYLQNNKSIVIGSIVNIEDISERVRAENMRKDFVANVSHELKTPLTSISGFAETLKLNENIDKETRNRFLTIIDGEANRLRRLIEDILTLSFIENDKKEEKEAINLYSVYRRVEDMLMISARTKNISLNCNADETIKIAANADYVKQIILNLVDNAIKYTPENGDVNVKIFADKDDAVIKVSDTGMGIPKEDQARIFERFYRVDKARSREIGGTGLGLAITKHIAMNLGGTISVESELEKGSTFTVRIPMKRD